MQIRSLLALSFALHLCVAPAFAQEEGPIEGPLEGPVEGPLEGPVEEGSVGSEEPEEDAWTTGIKGRVLDSKTGEPIMEGTVIAVEVDVRTVTDIDGNFSLDLQPGVYTIRSYYELYQPGRIENIEVKEGERTSLDIQLEPESGESFVDEIVVTARADTNSEATQMQVRRNTAAVRDAVSAEQIAKSGDGSASSAAKRVVATTVVGGKYLYVRGLGGRYTNVLLNGASLPQVDPDVPGVQLDLFPSSVLSNIAVLKSYSPELPGAFGGGTMLMQSRSYPEDFQLKFSLGTGFNSETTFRESPDYEGGKRDWLGFDDGSRAIPSAVAGRFLSVGDDFTKDEVTAASAEFQPIRDVQRKLAIPPIKFGVSVGNRVRVGKRHLGFLLSAAYSVTPSRIDEELGSVSLQDGDGGLRQLDNLQREASTRSTNLSSLGTISLELDDFHTLSFTSLFNQSSAKYTGVVGGYNEERDRQVQQARQRFVARTLSFNQLSGTHVLGNGQLDWRLNGTFARRDEPDTRDVLFQSTDEGFAWADRQPIDGQHLFLDLEQTDFGGGFDAKIPLGPIKGRFGGAFALGKRKFTQRRFDYVRNRRASAEDLSKSFSEVFAPERAGELWSLSELTMAEDSYTAREDLFALYASLDWQATSSLRFFAGLRMEAFRQTLGQNSPFEPTTSANPMSSDEIRVRRTDIDPLPVASAVWEITNDLFLRGSYGVTVARPRARELSGTLITDFVRRQNIFGDPTLQRTRIQHADARWEWFPSPTDVLAISAFAKVFDNPIELVILDVNRTVSYRNIESATNLGAEVELKLGLGRFADILNGLNFGGNLTIVKSKATLTSEQAQAATSAIRPLVGQSPWVANFNVSYSPEEKPYSINVFYNVFGRRLQAAGANGLPDVFEEPFHSLDVTGSWEIDEHWTLRGAVKNVLNQSRRYSQGSINIRRFKPGVSVSLGVTLTL